MKKNKTIKVQGIKETKLSEPKKESEMFKLGKSISDSKNTEFFKLDLPNLDYAISNGRGFPWKKIAVIKGREGTGKTSLILWICSKCIEYGGHILYIDAEHKLNPSWVEKFIPKNGLSKFVISDAITMEESFIKATEAISIANKENKSILIIIDSMNALPSQQEMDKDYGASMYSPQAKIASDGIRKFNSYLGNSEANVSLILISQLRDKVGMIYGDKTETAWGNAPKYYSVIGLDLKKDKIIQNSSKINTGQFVNIKIGKNQISVPGREAMIKISYTKGIIQSYSYLDLLEMTGEVKTSGAWSVYKDLKWCGALGFNKIFPDIKKDLDQYFEGFYKNNKFSSED